MGCDIHSFAEVKRNGKWQKEERDIFYGERNQPFETRNYNMFGFLRNVRNYANVQPLDFKDYLPNDSEHLNKESKYHQNPFNQILEASDILTIKREVENDFDYHSLGHIYLSDILKYNYDLEFLNECSKVKHTVREMLESSVFFEDVEVLKTLGEIQDVRVCFWFDN